MAQLLQITVYQISKMQEQKWNYQYCPAIPFPGTQANVYTSTFRAVLFTTKCGSSVVHTMEYCPTLRRKEILT